MNRNLAFAALLVWAVLLTACSSMQSMMGMGSGASLPATLSNQLGVSESQATGGTGAILAFAQQRLAAGDFDIVAKAIPGSEQYLGLAKQLLGSVNISDKAGLQSAFSKMGMAPDMLSKFTPIVTDYVSKAGSDQASKLLAGLLK
ncbi:MAG TPA: DUF2780 domain-containing protein [Burkholderiales bacterium]|nr:DUF2780 domain-containing protein [Burkholderiales bacterium]